MSEESIRAALGALQDNPEDETPWTELTDAVTAPAPGIDIGALRSLIESARRGHEIRREWDAVARMLEIEVLLHSGGAVEFAMQFELARVVEDELLEDDRAVAAYKRLLELRPDEPTAREGIERAESKREKWQEHVKRYLDESAEAGESPFRATLLLGAAETTWRFGKRSKADRKRVIEYLAEAMRIDPRNARAGRLLERVYRLDEKWQDVARVLDAIGTSAHEKDERAAALLRLGRLARRKLNDDVLAAEAYDRVLDFWPTSAEARGFLSEHFSKTEQWDHLVALYEDQLRGGGARPGEEAGVIFQIAMVTWRMRGDAAAAEPYFDRLRRLEPAHPGMLGFFRERCTESGDLGRLMTILTDAQRSMSDGPDKAAIATEIAKLAEAGANATKAIEQYKTILRQNPNNQDAREALKRLYRQTEGWNALVELLRQDLERTPADDKAARANVLREIATVYREHIKNDAALATVLTQIVQIDETDADALHDLVRVYESLGRFRDLLQQQTKLAEILPAGEEKAELLRAVARRWLDQFSNAQNATEAYESLLQIQPDDSEAIGKLRELYTKRRAFGPLYQLFEREAQSRSGAERAALLVEMAKLAAERLDRGPDAIRLYKEVLELEPARLDVLDALEKQAERDKDFATVAGALEHRLGMSTDDTSRLTVLLKLGSVYGDRLNDVTGAARTWRRVLELQPGHSRALRVLRDTCLSTQDYDGLEDLYASQKDWEGLAEVLTTAADRASDPDVAVDLSFRTARVLTSKIGNPERAFRSYERVLSLRPADEQAARALVPIYEAEQKWARLPALYEILFGKTENADEQAGLLKKLVSVTGQQLGDRPAALGWARKAYDLLPSDETLEELEEASRAARSFDEIVHAIDARLKRKKGVGAAERRSLLLRLAKIHATELGQTDEAVSVYKALVEDDPTNEEVTSAFDRLLRANDRRDDLRWLFEKRAERAEGMERAGVLTEWATLEEEVFAEPNRSIDLFRRVLELDPANETALRTLPRLLLGAGRAEDAAKVIETHRDLLDGDPRAVRELDLCDLYLDWLPRPVAALEAVLRSLEITPHAPRAVALLERLLANVETRPRAAVALEAEYASSGDSRKEAQALAVHLETTSAKAERLELYFRLAELEETRLSSTGRAFDVVLRAVGEFPENIDLWDRAGELAQRSGRPTDLAETYRLALAQAGRLSESVELDLCERAAALHDERLGDPEAATPYLERVLARRPGDEKAFLRLKQILTGREKWGELETLYDQAISGTTDPARRAELLNEVALVCEEITNEPDKAIGYYEAILEIDAHHEHAMTALEQLYGKREQPAKLASLLERRLETASPESTIELKVRLGRIDLDDLHEPARAFVHLEEVLRLEPDNHDARKLMERILDIGTLRTRAAEVLELVYEARDEVRDLVRALEIRLEGSQAEDLQRELLRRIAGLRDERLKDDAGALDALARLVPLDPADTAARTRLLDIAHRLGAEARVTDVLLRGADRASTPTLACEILMEVAAVYEEMLGDAVRAEEIYRRALEIDRHDAALALAPAKALERIYTRAGQNPRLADILEIEVELEDSVDVRAELLARLGALAEDVLADPARAVAAWRKRLEGDPADDRALGSLERLFEKTSAWRDLISTLRAREQIATDGGTRRELLVKVARTFGERLEDPAEAITAWRTVADEFGVDRASLDALEGLYERTERWDDLADTLELDLGFSEAPEAKVQILARLGEIRRAHQQSWTSALEAFRQALAIDPAHATSRRGAEKLLDDPDARREAAETLHPLYEADGDHERLLRVLEIEADAADDSVSRLALLERAVQVASVSLANPRRAFGYVVRAVREAAGDAAVTTWIEAAEKLAGAIDGYRDLVALLREVVPEILDGDIQLAVTLQIGDLARTRLLDLALAREYYQKALELRGDDRRALTALESLYEESHDSSALLEIIRRRADVASDDAEKKSLLLRQARLSGEALGDRAGAIATYEAILDLDFDAEAVTELEKLYPAASRWGDLIALYERELEHAGRGRPEPHVKIAVVACEQTNDLPRAFDELAEALSINPQQPDAIAVLEKLMVAAPDAERRAQAAEMLEPVYVKRSDWKQIIATIEARLAFSQDPDERRPLLKRLANLLEEQAEDYKGALETNAKLLHEDLADDATFAELERLAKVSGSEARLAEIYAAELDQVTSDEDHTARLCHRTGDLFKSLGDVDRALTYYRRALAFAPDSRPLFQAIDGLLVQANRPKDRVELYRQTLEQPWDAGERLALLHTMAELQRQALGEPDAAIDTYRAALEVDDTDKRALAELATLYRERKRFTDLADLYRQQAEAARDAKAANGFRLLLARLLRVELTEIGEAIDQYEAIVQAEPRHAEAVADLEALVESEHKARIVDILRPLYEGADDWRHLVELNRQRFELASEKTDKVAVLRETATLWETRGKNRANAFAALRRAFELDPDDGETRAELERIAEALGAWDDLADAYEHGVNDADPLVKRELLRAVAQLHDKRRDDPRQALAAYDRLAALDDSDPEPLDAMIPLATLLSDWPTLVKVLSRRADLMSDDGERASLLRQIGETKRDMLDDPRGAVVAYERALELDPESTFTIDCLISLYEAADESSKLVDLYRRRVELCGPDDADLKHQLLTDAADRYENRLSSRPDAILCLREALDARPADAATLRSLNRLFRAEELWPDLLENLRLEVEGAATPTERVALRKQMGELLAKRLDDAAGALDTYRLVLADAPDDDAIEAAVGIGESHEELGLTAAEILEPVLRAGQKFERLVTVLEMRVRAQSEPLDRARTLRALAVVLETSLSRPVDAEAALLRAISESPDDPSLFDEIERLAGVCDGWKRYAEVLEERAGTTFDADIARDLWSRLGRVAEERLHDDARAIAALGKAAEQASDDVAILASLDRLHTRAGDARALSAVLERRIEAEADPRVQADLLHRLAMLTIVDFKDKVQGLATLKIALERDPDHQAAREGLESLTDDSRLFDEAAEVLEQVYRNRGDDERLTRLYEKRISHAPTPEERVRMRLDLARLIEERTKDQKRSQKVLEDALADAPDDIDLLGEIERLAPLTGNWQSAADSLSTRIAEARDLSPESRRDVLVRLASWYKNHLASPAKAEAALEGALAQDPENIDVLRSIEQLRRAPGRERDLVATLRTIATLTIDASTKNDLFREAKNLAEGPLADAKLTEEVLRQMLHVDDADLWALEELSRVREAAGDYKELLALLLRRAELTTDEAPLSALRHRAAEVAKDKLADEARATELFESIFEATPDDERAAVALRQLYTSRDRVTDLERLLSRLIDVAKSPADRTRIRLELARLRFERGQHDDAIETLRALLDEEPGESQAVLLLSQLYETTGRDEDLADLLTGQIDRAKERGDATSELALIVRLGEVFESRLSDAQRAIETYQAVLLRDPAHTGALEALARLHEGKKDYAAAATTLDKLLGLAPAERKLELALRLAACFDKLGDAAGTRRALEQGLATDRRNAEVRQRLAALCEAAQDFAALADMVAEDAELADDKAVKIRHYRRAADLHLAKRNDPARAAEMLERASQLAPDDRDLLLALCDTYSKAGRGKDAAAALQKIVASFGGKRTKELANIHQRLSRAYLADGDKPRALTELDQAFKMDPGSISILRDLGTLSIELGDLDRAQKTFRALLLQKLDPGAAIGKGEVFYYLAEIAKQQGDKTKAIQMLDRALENEPSLAKAKDLLAELKK